MNNQLLKKSREVLESILREMHDDIDSTAKSEIEKLIAQINSELDGKSPEKTTKRDVLETIGLLLGCFQKGAELIEKLLSLFNS
ncbi:hypothetical protein FCV66_12890 [Enterovibrio norvegicus]|uniref:hypothetical protein n=1 Tax=Enterovibrio norvegicus TaxID=188144 RepID=UPI0010BE8CAB|nr:hypothetical protein [Enterovibrio norvegicus]TKF13718.1 hypothetical protein FCV66_12890 [Enterovibrio norvegicus]